MFLVNKYGDEDIILTIYRNGKYIQVRIKPVQTGENQYKMGMWVRDDTQGIGTKVAEDSFKEKLVGKNAETDTLDTISGATVSSKPVVEGIQEAGKYLSENLK